MDRHHAHSRGDVTSARAAVPQSLDDTAAVGHRLDEAGHVREDGGVLAANRPRDSGNDTRRVEERVRRREQIPAARNLLHLLGHELLNLSE